MKRFGWILGVVAVAAACDQPERGALTGRVLLVDRAGLDDQSRVRVTLDPGPGTAVPDDAGAFTLEDLEPGSRTLVVTYSGAPGSASPYRRWAQPVDITGGATWDAGDIRLVLGTGSITGRVEDAAGAGVTGARVMLSLPGATQLTATTGSGGSYQFTDVPVGLYALAASADALVPPGGACNVSGALETPDGAVTAPALVLASTAVSLAPGAAETTSVNGTTWNLAAPSVTVHAVAEYADQSRHWVEGSALPAWGSFQSPFSVSGLATGATTVLHAQFASSCGYDSDILDIQLVVP